MLWILHEKEFWKCAKVFKNVFQPWQELDAIFSLIPWSVERLIRSKQIIFFQRIKQKEKWSILNEKRKSNMVSYQYQKSNQVTHVCVNSWKMKRKATYIRTSKRPHLLLILVRIYINHCCLRKVICIKVKLLVIVLLMDLKDAK